MPLAWCTQADVEDVLSQEGVVWASDDDRDGIMTEANVTNAIARARIHIMQYIGTKYASDAIAVTEWGQWVGAKRAVYELMTRRNEGVPASLQMWWEELLAFLERVAAGTMQIPDAEALQNFGGIAVSNVTHDMRPQIKQIRKVGPTSTAPNKSDVPVPGLIQPPIDFS